MVGWQLLRACLVCEAVSSPDAFTNDTVIAGVRSDWVLCRWSNSPLYVAGGVVPVERDSKVDSGSFHSFKGRQRHLGHASLFVHCILALAKGTG